MDFAWTEEQEQLRKSARDFLAANWPREAVRAMEERGTAHSPELWGKMADLGWLGLLIPKQYEGSGASLLDMVVLLEECGKAIVPRSFLTSAILGTLPLVFSGNEKQKCQLLPKLARGERIGTLAVATPGDVGERGDLILDAKRGKESMLLKGRRRFVPNASVADFITCVAKQHDELVLVLAKRESAGVICQELFTIFPEGLCDVHFDDLAVSKTDVLCAGKEATATLERAIAWATIAQCAEMIGGAQRVLDMSVNYAKTRVQFGKPIGTFQAVQHHCSNMLIDLEGARFLVYQAAWRASAGLPCGLQLAMAKSRTNEAYKRITGLAQQVYGGTGFHAEAGIHFSYKRAKTSEANFGGTDYHLEKIAQHLKL